jgi:AAHS family 4-hydroxybenzoate transporter-like MFS transporter
MGFYFLLSWTPTLLVAAKLPLSTAGLAISSLQVGGTVGALLLARWFERQQFLAISLVFLISVPAVAAIGFAGVSSVPVLMIVTFFAGFCVLGVQTGINVVGALVYPTSLRANGSGWELGIGRIGSIVGPLLGALFVGMPVQHLYAWSSLPFLAGAIVCFIIHRLNQARLRERPYLQQPVAAE